MTSARRPFLLIEGGGSHTVALLHDGNAVRPMQEGASSNAESVGKRSARQNLAELVARTTTGFSGTLDVFVAHGAASTRGRARRLAREVLGLIRPEGVNALTVVNDLVPLACLYPDQDVVICAAGTGTGYVARSRDGQWARASGFEFIMSDEGGGFWIGQQVLSSIVRAHDGRGPKTILSKIVGDRLSLDPDRYLPSLFEWLHADQRQLKFQTASLADAVFEAFDCEDEVARIIIDRIVHELAIGVEAVRRAVGSEMQKARLLLTGSLLACNDYLVDALTTRLTALKATTKLYPTGRTDYLIDWIENWPRICESDRMPPALPIYVRHVPGEFE